MVHPEDEGYGAAGRAAFERTGGGGGDVRGMGDADYTYDFGAMDRLCEPVILGEADLVMGGRLAGEIEPVLMQEVYCAVGNPLITRFLNALYNAGVTGAHSVFGCSTAN